ncbi:tail component [Xenorhabdus mauleonii]|uniref:Phage tail tape measure protein, lambda family n=1 Tax=Xenorhabdus mauleonii TaxID=351675 RepID=A0A1I3XUV1_9GAMM|nr:phage tail tape measure protein [Xenorhabdus mauleonii]PHM45874.1 tail component [Xenorhabdus mauleonii]SFK23253.1 phage tail tape measure protein, lambda family [Xenorhabdus mauleonii]
MAKKLRELIIKISANSSSYQAEIARAARLGENYHRVMENGNRSAAAAARGSTAALRDLNNQLVSVKASALGMAGSFAGIFATSKLVETADKWTNLNARLKLATQSTTDLTHSQRLLMEMSQKTGTSFEANATVFARSAAPMRALKYASQDIVNMTETLATGLKISGASAAESSSVLIQFSQAMSSGVLRGEEFNAMAENGGRLIQALADGMGVARTQLKGMANDGLLTMDKVIPALLSQLGKLQDEYGSMGATVEKSMARVQNAFMQWVGDVNQSTATTKVLSGTLDTVSKNIDAIATGLGVVAAIGAARVFGDMANGAISSARGVFQAYRAEVALADAQVRGTQVATARARAAVYRAQQALISAQNTDKQALAEKRLTQAQAQLNRNIEARKAAQNRLNGVTSAGSRLLGGALGLIGGIPGLVLMGAGAWYTMYQNQEQARQSAREYGNTIQEVRQKIDKMSAPQLADNSSETINAAKEQERVVAEQEKKIHSLKNQIAGLQEILAKPGGMIGDYMINHLMSRTEATQKLKDALLQLSAEEERLGQQQNHLTDIQETLAEIDRRRIDLLKQKTAEEAAAHQSLLMMNAAHSEFNRLMSVGNSLLEGRQQHVQIPLMLPQAPLDDKQRDFLNKSERDRVLSSLQGEDKIRKQAEFAAEDQGLNTLEHQSNYQKYLNNVVATYRNGEKAREAQTAAAKAASDAAKAAREAASAQADYRNKVSELNTQLATEAIRYREGNTAAEAFAASMSSGKNFTEAQNNEIRRLNRTLEEAKQKYQDLQDAIANDPFRNTAETAKKAREQLERQLKSKQVTPKEYDRRKEDIWQEEVRGNTSAKQQYVVSAKDALLGEVDPIQDLDNQLARKKALYEAYAETQVIGVQRKNELILAAERDTDAKRIEAAKQVFASQGDLQSLAVTMFETTQERMGNMVTGLLTGSKSLREGMSEMFASLAQDVVKSLVKMAAQALITNTIMKGLESMGGGGMGAGFASLFVKNAKGGVYNSPSLSQYSGQIVNQPTVFAFAKGAGLMGEAGPEAIMPLTRGADGSLGVRVITPKELEGNGKGSTKINVYITDGKTESTSSNSDKQAFGREFGQAVAQVYFRERDKDLRQGGVINKAIRGGR